MTEYERGLVTAYEIIQQSVREDDADHIGPRVLYELAISSQSFMQQCYKYLRCHGYEAKGVEWHKGGFILHGDRAVVNHCGGCALLTWPPYRTFRGWDS